MSAHNIETAQEKLLDYYPFNPPIAVCFRIGWTDEKIWLVPLEKMAQVTREEKLIRTTLCLN